MGGRRFGMSPPRRKEDVVISAAGKILLEEFLALLEMTKPDCMLNEKPFRNITNHMNVMLSESEASAGSTAHEKQIRRPRLRMTL